MTEPLDPAELEDERDFLLSSLRDLELEHAAGDLDDQDYEALRDDYTARAARVLRALEVGRAAPAPAVPRRRGRSLVVGGLVVAFAVLAGVLVAQSVGRRDPGDTATGGIRQSVTERLNEARRRLNERDLDAAVAGFDEVLAVAPDNVEALTYKGWALSLAGEGEGITTLIDAAELDPTFPDVHAFLAIVFFRQLGRAESAYQSLRRLDALDPPPMVLDLVAGIRAEIEAARSAAPAPTGS